VLEVPQTDLGEHSSQVNVANWDSLNHMKLVVALEEEFGVKFKDEDILELQSFKLIKFILSKYLK